MWLSKKCPHPDGKAYMCDIFNILSPLGVILSASIPYFVRIAPVIRHKIDAESHLFLSEPPRFEHYFYYSVSQCGQRPNNPTFSPIGRDETVD
ncbi:Uncharacterised protein [Chlamydia trachomatis]|nr:Uncharacterised protein [Chlamydia trachomatis]